MGVKLTVVGIDLVRSSEFTAELERIMGGPQVVVDFFEDMENFVYNSFCLVMSNPSEYEIFQRLEGDAFRVSFEKADDAYKFVKKLGQDFEEYHNANSEVKKRVFRIGAATGNVHFNKSADKADPNKITSDIVLRRVARLRDGAQPGYFYVDEATFNGFTDDVKKNFSEVLVKTKPHENDISAWRVQVILDISASSKKSSSRKEVRDKLEKLVNYQIIEVARSIGMDENSFTGDYIRNHRGDAIGDLLDFAQRNNLLGKIESAIQE